MSCEGKRSLALFAALSVIGALSSCSSAPQQGTPAYYWLAAKETYAAGDFNKTLDHLDQLISGDNDYTARALPWFLVVSSGMASGYMEVADTYEQGIHATKKGDPIAFRRQMDTNRTLAKRLVLQTAEDFAKLDKIKGDTIPLAFAFPKGSAAPVPQFAKLSAGTAVPPAEMETAQRQSVERGIVLAACKAVGAPGDTAKAQELLKTADAQVPRATFMMAMADALYEGARLYGPDKLQDSEKMEILAQRAQLALKTVPESKDTKDLDAKLQKLLKKPGKKT